MAVGFPQPKATSVTVDGRSATSASAYNRAMLDSCSPVGSGVTQHASSMSHAFSPTGVSTISGMTLARASTGRTRPPYDSDTVCRISSASRSLIGHLTGCGAVLNVLASTIIRRNEVDRACPGRGESP